MKFPLLLFLICFGSAEYFITLFTYYAQILEESECSYLNDLDQYFIPTLSNDIMVISLYSDVGCKTYMADVTFEELGYHVMDVFLYTEKLPSSNLVNLKYGCDNSYGINYYQLEDRNTINETCYIEQTVVDGVFSRKFYESEDATDSYRTDTFNCGDCFEDELVDGEMRTVDCSRVVS
ncbi:Uncharacterized protein QTN25_008979 [Entamoeba marina]